MEPMNKLSARLTLKGIRVLLTTLILSVCIISAAQTPVLVKDICPGNCSGADQYDAIYAYENFVGLNGVIYFMACDTFIDGLSERLQLWRTDGSDTGTHKVHSVDLGNRLFHSDLIAVNGLILFAGVDSSGVELWRSDGTPGGTYLIRDIHPTGDAFSALLDWMRVRDYNVVNDLLIFRALVPGPNLGVVEVWVSDGTESGTHLLKDLHIYEDGPEWFVPAGGKMFFRLQDSTFQNKVFATDGTEQGTVIIDSTHFLFPFGSLGDTMYLGRTIYKSDGTPGGTTMVGGDVLFNKEITARRHSIMFQDKLFFPDSFSVNVTDGTAAGTQRVKQVFPYHNVRKADIDEFTVLNDKLFFVANDTTPFTQGNTNREVWVSDGTSAGTHILRDIHAGLWDSDPQELTVAGGKLYFSANDSIHGVELWESDGTEAGTILHDLLPGIAGSYPHHFFNAGDALYFFAFIDSAVGSELYKIDLPPNDVNELPLSQDEILLFPNPSYGKFQIEFAGEISRGAHEIFITDMQGKEVFRTTNNGCNRVCEVNAGGLESGCYLLHMISDGRAIKPKLVVITDPK